MRASLSRTLPLGIDLGATRVRVALGRLRANGAPELVAVATRDRGERLGETVADAVAELATRERRCVLSLAEPNAVLRAATFPPLRRPELVRAARFEVARRVPFAIDDAVVRIVPLEISGDWAIGVARREAIDGLRAVATAAKLRIVAIDNAAFALRRANPDADAVLDIGLDGALLHVFGRGIPRALHWPFGGAAFSGAIVAALGTDAPSAERRKIAHGIAGCADALTDQLGTAVADAFADCRASGYADVRRLALVGNGSRLDGLAAALERSTMVRVRPATLAPETSSTLPADVLRAAAPDWSLAWGLALWATG